MDSQDYLIPLSALQHLHFCRRQCALIHIERIWEDNYFTLAGELFHNRVDQVSREKRKGKIQEFGLPLRTIQYGLIGKADSVEFFRNEQGELQKVVPVEYKRGKKKEENWDRIQLCAQALCLEEMLNIRIPTGFLFYGKDRTREEVSFGDELRQQTIDLSRELHILIESGETPPAVITRKCKSCSLYSYCKPGSVGRGKSVSRYISQMIKEDLSNEETP
jgi:CRISPR-associated exonuclease Cas4